MFIYNYTSQVGMIGMQLEEQAETKIMGWPRFQSHIHCKLFLSGSSTSPANIKRRLIC